jgi:carbon-monoxide dehydrogenase large subunit
MTSENNKWIGQSVARLEDPPLVQGQGRYAGDISFPHQLHMRVARSNHAHGRIAAIDTAAARAVPGVVAVWTAADIADVPPIDFREGRIPALEPYRQPVLARERVRYVGEPIAAVFAEDPYVAEDAADLVTVKISELPALLAADAEPGEFADDRNTEVSIIRQGYGDVDATLAAAPMVVELELAIGRHSGVPLEARGAIGRYDLARDILELHGAAKVPHRNRDLLARMLNLAPSAIHVHESHVGGGFGIRGELYPEDVLVCVAAMRLRRAVKWLEDRREHLIAANHSRQQLHRIRAAIDREGRILAIDDRYFHDQGAYVRTHAARVVHMTAGILPGILPGPYRVPAYRAVGHFRLTNKTPAATYRAPGRYETTFVRERLIDAIATKLGVDGNEIRRRNAIGPDEMPYHRPLEALGEEIEYDTGDYVGLLDRLLTELEWPKLKADIARRRAAGEAVGAGFAMFVEKSGLGPTDGVRIEVDTTGAVELVTGGASLGQGFETVMAQVCAEAIGVDYRRVRVTHGQTDRIAHGIGAHASRATVMTASATHNGAIKLRAKAIEVAAELLQAPRDTLDVVEGKVMRKDQPAGPSISLGEIAEHLAPTSKTLGNREPGLSAEGWFRVAHQVYPYGMHFAVVKVDRDTGAAHVERYVIAYDIGRAINPALVKGQIVGGFTQGLGGTLLEEFSYNERGDPLATTFADYLMPTVRETPDVDVMLREDYQSPLNPLGIKGAGESGITGVGAAIASAIDDAVGIPGAVAQLPITPQRLKEILNGQR